MKNVLTYRLKYYLSKRRKQFPEWTLSYTSFPVFYLLQHEENIKCDTLTNFVLFDTLYKSGVSYLIIQLAVLDLNK